MEEIVDFFCNEYYTIDKCCGLRELYTRNRDFFVEFTEKMANNMNWRGFFKIRRSGTGAGFWEAILIWYFGFKV
jgi:hypothetical protein